MDYVDGFVLAVPKTEPCGVLGGSRGRPERSGRNLAPIDYRESVGDDVSGKVRRGRSAGASA